MTQNDPSPKPFAPAAIYISHNHEDHYGGIVRLIELMAGNRFQPSRTADQKMFFNGPLVVSFRKLTKELTEINKALIDAKFDWGAGLTGAIPDFTIDYPSPAPADNMVLTYTRKRPSDQPPLKRTFNVDQSQENAASLLMTHEVLDPTTGNVRSRMLFTGDGIGHIISDNVITPQPRANRVYSIYKIQHHGSLHNSQVTETAGTVSASVANEAQLRGILTWGLRTGSTAAMIKILGLTGNYRLRFYRKLKAYLATKGYGTDVDLENLLLELNSRDQTYMTSCANLSTKTLSAPDTKYSKLFTGFVKSVTDNPKNYPVFYHPLRSGRATSSGLGYTIESWWKKYSNPKKWTEKYESLLTTTRVAKYFSSFDAQAYVVSSNRSHGHVNAELIIGLGTALRRKFVAGSAYGNATLFITTAQSVDLSDIDRLCTLTGITMSSLFQTAAGTGGLEIRFLQHKAFMTLDATSATVTGGNRDINNRSLALATTGTFTTVSTLKEKMELDTTPLPNPRAIVELFNIGTVITDSSGVPVNWYLDLSAASTASPPKMVKATAPTSCTVLDAWAASGPLPLNYVQTVVATATSSVVWTVRVEHTSNDQWALFPVLNATTEYAISINPTNNQPVVNPVPANTAATSSTVSFEFLKLGSLPTLPALRDPLPTQKFKQYCADAQINPASIAIGSDAITAVAGADNFQTLGFRLDYELIGLRFPANLDSSFVTYWMDELNIIALSSTIQLSPPAGTTITIGPDTLQVIGASLTVTWSNDLTVLLDIAIVPTSLLGGSLTSSRTVANAPRSTTLDRYLLATGFLQADLPKVTMGKILVNALGDESTTLEMLTRLPQPVLLAGLMTWQPDHLRSTVAASLSPMNWIAVPRLRLVFDVSKIPSVQILGISFTFASLEFVLVDAQLSTQKLTLQGAVTVMPQSGKGPTVQASLSVTLSDVDTEFTFSLQTGSSITDLAKLIPGSSTFQGASVPFKGSPLSSLKSSGVGFVLKQPITAAATYQLASVFGGVTLNDSDWRSFLPSGFPAPVKSSVRAEVISPTNPNTVAVRVLVNFIATIGSATGKDIQVVFAAEPLASSDDYEYRVSLSSTPHSQPATFREILAAVGMSSALDSLRTYIPFIADIFDHVSLNEISAAIEKDSISGALTFTEYIVDLNISEWSIISNVIELDFAQIRIESAGDNWRCRVDSSMFIGSQFEIDISVLTPTATEIGYLKFDNPDGLSCTDLLNAFNFPSLNNVPVISTLLSAELMSAEVTFGYGVTGGRDATIEVSGATLTSLKMEYQAALPDGTPTSYNVIAQSSGMNAEATISISCLVSSPATTKITATIKSTSEGSLTVTGLLSLFGLDFVLGYDPPKGSSVFDFNVELASAELSIPDAKTKGGLQIDRVHLIVDKEQELTILENPSFKFKALRLELDYHRQGESTGKIFAAFDFLGVDVWLFYFPKSLGQEVFISLAPTDMNPKSFKDMAGFLGLQPSDYAKPPNLNIPGELPCANVFGIFTRGVSMELRGNAQTTFNFNVGNINVMLTEVGGRALVYEAPPRSNAIKYEAYIYGSLAFTGFHTAGLNSYASLRIGSGQEPIMTAAIQPLPTAVVSSSIDALTGQMSSDGNKISSLLPSGTANMDFRSDFLFFYLNANTGQFVLAGEMAGLGQTAGILISAPLDSDPKKRSYFFSLNVANLSGLWPSLSARLAPYITFKTAGVQILDFNTTVDELRDKLKGFDTESKAAGIVVSNSWVMLPHVGAASTSNLVPGATMYATLDLNGTGTVVNKLGRCSNDPNASSVSLWAHMDMDLKNTAFKIQVQNLALFGGAIVLTEGDGTYTTSSSLKTSTQIFEFAAHLRLNLTSSRSFEFDIDFTLTDSETGSNAVFSATTAVDIPTPFDGMYSLTLPQVKVSGRFDFTGQTTKTSYMLEVNKKVAGLDLVGSILFYDDNKGNLSPMVARVIIQDRLSVLNVFKFIIAPEFPNATWPSSIIPIVFVGGEIYYCNWKGDDPITIGTMQYKKGYHVWADIEIFKSVMFRITADLPASSAKAGITVVGEHLGILDLEFMQFSNPNFPKDATRGPFVTIDTTDKNNEIYKLDSELTIFGLTGLALELQYQSGGIFNGSVTYSGTFLGFTNPKIGIQHKDDSWTLTEFPFDTTLGDILKLGDMIKAACALDAQQGSKCPLATLVQDIIKIKTDFNKVKVNDFGLSGANITAKLKGSFDLYVLVGPGQGDPNNPHDNSRPLAAVNIEFPITVPIPKEWTADGVLGCLVKALLDNIAVIGQSILDSPVMEEILALYTAAELAKLGLSSLSALLCRDKTSKKRQDSSDDASDDASGSGPGGGAAPGSPGSKSRDSSDNSKKARTIVDAAKSLHDADDFLKQCQSDMQELITLAEVMKQAGLDGQKYIDRANAIVQPAEAAYHGAQADLTDALIFSGSPVASLKNSSLPLLVDLSSVLPNAKSQGWYENWNNFRWKISYASSSDISTAKQIFWSPTSSSPPFVVSINDPDILNWSEIHTWADSTYTYAPTGKIFISTMSKAGNVIIQTPVLPPVASVSFGLSKDAYTCTVAIPTTSRGTFQFKIAGGPAGQTVLGSRTVTVASESDATQNFSIMNDFIATVSVNSVQAWVQAIATDGHHQNSSWTASANSMAVVIPPSGLAASMNGNTLVISWLEDKSANPDLLLTKTDGTVWTRDTMQPSFSAGTVTVNVTGPDVINNAVVDIGARIKPAVGVIGLFAVLNNFLMAMLPPLTIASTSWFDQGSNNLHLEWNWPSQSTIPITDTFSIRLLPQNTIVPLQNVNRPSGATSASVDYNIGAAPVPASVQIRVEVPGGIPGPWSDPYNITSSLSLPPPVAPTISLILSFTSTPVLSVSFTSSHPAASANLSANLSTSGKTVTQQSFSIGVTNITLLPDGGLNPLTTYTISLAYWAPSVHGKSAVVTYTSPSRMDLARQLFGQKVLAINTWHALDAFGPLSSSTASAVETACDLLLVGYNSSDVANAIGTLGKMSVSDFSKLQAYETCFATIARSGVPLDIAVSLASAMFASFPPVAIAAMVASGAPVGSWAKYAHLTKNTPPDDAALLDSAVYGKPWLLPSIAQREGVSSSGGPTLGFKLLRVAYPRMTAVLGFAVLNAGLGSLDLGEAQSAWGIADQNAFAQMQLLIQDNGPGGTDPGRKFVLETRREGQVPDDDMKGYLLMLHPGLTPQQLAHAMRP
ncbi:hypothetical protein PSPO01_16040 [Paraphaeosphaeria sporulosa]